MSSAGKLFGIGTDNQAPRKSDVILLRAAVAVEKSRRGGASFRFHGVALLSVLGGSVWALGWLYFAVQLALMGRYLQKAI